MASASRLDRLAKLVQKDINVSDSALQRQQDYLPDLRKGTTIKTAPAGTCPRRR